MTEQRRLQGLAARAFQRLGQLVDDADERFVEDVLAATQRLHFAARAWALERNCVRTAHGVPVAYQARERILPVSKKAEAALSHGGFLGFLRARTPTVYVVDVEKLADSLRADPVEGMDPDHLFR